MNADSGLPPEDTTYLKLSVDNPPLSEEDYQEWAAALAECRSASPIPIVLSSFERDEELRAEGRIQAARRLGVLEGSAIWKMMTEGDSE